MNGNDVMTSNYVTNKKTTDIPINYNFYDLKSFFMIAIGLLIGGLAVLRIIKAEKMKNLKYIYIWVHIYIHVILMNMTVKF